MISLGLEEGDFVFDGITWSKSSFRPGWLRELLLEEPKIIFEFGSFDGGDGIAYKNMYPEAEVYSFEPVPRLYEKVRRAEKYGVKTYNLAIYNREGTVPFYQGYHNQGECGPFGSILQVTEETRREKGGILEYSTEAIQVPCTTIAQFCLKNNITTIDFMHIDVEGVSREVIEGLGTIRPRLIFMELQSTENSHIGGSKAHEVIGMLTRQGYRLIASNNVDSLFQLM